MDLSFYLDDLHNPDPAIRASSIIALGKSGDPEAARPLVEILENKTEVEWLRGCAAISLGRLPGEEVVPSLLKALHDDSLLVARAAILALGDRKCQQALPFIEGILKDQSKKELHAVSVKILGDVGGREAAPTLLEALENPESGVRRNAALALGELHVEKAVLPLMKLLKDDDECLRAIAASSLGSIGDKQAALALIEALRDPSQTVRMIAASSLGCLGDQRAVLTLEKLLRDDNQKVRDMATMALSKFKSQNVQNKGVKG